jgi:predicted RNase H-like HicB family nuclease
VRKTNPRGAEPPGSLARQTREPRSTSVYTFTIVIEKEPDDDGYAAYSTTLPGCFSKGETFQEAKRNVHLAVQKQLESLLAEGKPVRQSENLVYVEELTVAVWR